jgi:hypothetical protein
MSTSQILRVSGSIASILLCVHSTRYLFSSPGSMWVLFHNMADLMIFFGFGFAGIVAELFPRDSFAYKTLKANLPFMNSLIGRSLFYVISGMFAMGNFSSSKNNICYIKEDNETQSMWTVFCILSGIFMCGVGAITLYTAIKYRIPTGTPQTQELLAKPATQSPPAVVDRILVPFAPFPTQV